MQVLIIEDHPLIVDVYINCLSEKIFSSQTHKFRIARNCKEGFDLINNKVNENSFELAIIDQNLPPYPEENIFHGHHLAQLLKKKSPECKIVMITSHSEIITIYDIIKIVSPHGLIIKSDMNLENLLQGILQIIKGSKFYSSTVHQIIKEIWKKELMIDDKNRQILLYLSKGYKIQDLEPIVTLSVSSIKRRVSQLKESFESSDISSLIKEASVQGFI